jgi:hypothetical protein
MSSVIIAPSKSAVSCQKPFTQNFLHPRFAIAFRSFKNQSASGFQQRDSI